MTKKINSIAENILGSRAFVWICAFVVYFAWFFNQPVIGLTILIILCFFSFVFCKDTTWTMFIFIAISVIFSDRTFTLEQYKYYIFLIIIPIAGAIINLVRFKGRIELKGMTIAMAFCALAWILQGIGRENRSIQGFLLCAGIGVILFLCYAFFSVTTRGKKEGLVEDLAYMLVVFSLILIFQMVKKIVELEPLKDFYYFLTEASDDINYGWGGRNNISTILCLTLPASFYFGTKKSKFSFIFIIYGFIQFAAILLTKSRGAMLFSCMFMPVLYLYTLAKSKHKIATLAVFLVFASVFVIAEWKSSGFIESIFIRFKNEGFDPSGREHLFNAGWEVFFRYPLFGVGFDYRNPIYYQIVDWSSGPTYYHSTFIQIFASLGLLGAVSYFYLYYWRYRIIFTDVTTLKFLLFIGMIMFEGYNMIDTNYFQPLGYIILMFISLSMEKGLEYKQAIPLVVKLFSGKIKQNKV